MMRMNCFSLDMNGKRSLDADVAAHVAETIWPGVLESAQMAFIRSVGEVVDVEAHRADIAVVVKNVGASGEVEQRVRGSDGFRLVCRVGMALAKVALHTQFDKGVVKHFAVSHKVVTQFRHPSGSRRAWKVAAVGWLVGLACVDKRETVLEMQLLEGMKVDGCLATQQAGVALGEDIGGQAFGEKGGVATGEDVVVDEVDEN